MKNYNMIVKTSLLLVLAISSSSVAWQETIDVDNIHYRWGTPYVPAFIIDFNNPLADVPMTPKLFTPAADFVPTGLYAGDWGNAVWDYVLTKLIERNGNSYYINGSFAEPYPPGQIDSASREGQIAVARIAARLGARIYFQNQSSEIYWPSRIGTGPPRQDVYDRIEAWANAMLINFVLNYELKEGILVWGLSEEIDMETAQEPLLTQCRNDIFGAMDPYHPAIIMVMGNSMTIQEELFTQWGDIPLMVTDIYPNHRTVARSQAANYLTYRLGMYQDMGMNHDSKLWLILPCFSQNYGNPSQGEGGFRALTPEELNSYLWAGLAYGTTGFYLFGEYFYHGFGRGALSRFDWIPTEEYMAAVRFYRIVRRLEPLVSRWEPAVASEFTNNFAIGWMQHTDFSGQFLVIANMDIDNTKNYSIPSDESYYELETFSRVDGSIITFAPGAGSVLFKGSAAELEELRELLGFGAGLPEETIIQALEAQIWTTDVNDEELIATRTSLTGSHYIGGKGGIPWVYSQDQLTELPSFAGEILTWDDDTSVPAGYYFPPRPGVGENMIFLSWDVSSLQNLTDVIIDSAIFEIAVSSGISGGKVAAYPVISDGDILMDDVLEFMPRWEKEQFTLSAGSSLRIEIGGMLREWINGDMANRGLLIVYCGWPDTINAIEISGIPALNVKYYRSPENCVELWQAGRGLLSDIDQNCYVDILDFAKFAEEWLQCNDPTDSNCL